MNLIEEYNAFERWLETNYLPATSQLLWDKLFRLFNRCGWAEWVIVDNLRLMSLMHINEKTLITAREKLIEGGFIEYQKGKKGSPNRYKMIFLTKNTVKYTDHFTVETAVKTAVKTAVETADINKLNKTKQKNNNIALFAEIVGHLNQKANKNYNPSTPKTQKFINARLAEGFTVSDFKLVIDCKSNEWLNSEYSQYLRPETLFGTKFEGYLQNAKAMKRANDNDSDMSEFNKRFREIQEEMEG